MSLSCPADAVKLRDAVCRTAGGPCDIDEVGVSLFCFVYLLFVELAFSLSLKLTSLLLIAGVRWFVESVPVKRVPLVGLRVSRRQRRM